MKYRILDNQSEKNIADKSSWNRFAVEKFLEVEKYWFYLQSFETFDKAKQYIETYGKPKVVYEVEV